VLYELVTSVQKECQEKVPESYHVGNYKSQQKKVRGLQSMKLEEAEEEEGQLISGLKSGAEVRRVFKTAGWGKERMAIRELLENCRKIIANYHCKVIQKHL
jgi:hypothetical protein